MTTAVSVVVPAYNAEATLEAALVAILAQDYPPERYEVIVVDNGSIDRSAAIAGRFASRVLILREARRGASAARNVGIRAARHPYVAFTDADCVPDPGWLRELVAAATGPDAADLVGGRIVAHAPRSAVETFAASLMDQERAIRVYRPPSVVTANLIVRRTLFDTIGFFDESLRRGQDVDLAYRAHFRHQATFAYAERAVVAHVNPRTLRALFRKGIQHGRAVAGVLDRHAGDLGELPWQRCVARRRYVAIARAAGAALVGPARGTTPTAATRMDALCQAVFEAGKQFGVLVGTARAGLPRRRERRSVPA
jgi:glycosyltransferase involved in cell wall biosynthesis